MSQAIQFRQLAQSRGIKFGFGMKIDSYGHYFKTFVSHFHFIVVQATFVLLILLFALLTRSLDMKLCNWNLCGLILKLDYQNCPCPLSLSSGSPTRLLSTNF